MVMVMVSKIHRFQQIHGHVKINKEIRATKILLDNKKSIINIGIQRGC
jgi:hydrogenase-4 membrane subunit HyfE